MTNDRHTAPCAKPYSFAYMSAREGPNYWLVLRPPRRHADKGVLLNWQICAIPSIQSLTL